jgi:subtilase family serine protease
VTVPSSIASGTYYLGACADDPGAVTESSETNNCLAASTTTVQVQAVPAWPDLVVSALSFSPSSVRRGSSFTVTDTTNNSGTATAGGSTTRYRLSTDATITGSDVLLTGSRSVPSLATGVSSGGSIAVTVPSTVAPGTYYLGACADDPGAVTESNETNNCRASTTTIKVRK